MRPRPEARVAVSGPYGRDARPLGQAGQVGGATVTRGASAAGDAGAVGQASQVRGAIVSEARAASYYARWRPVLAGADALRARELTIALPPLCRSTSADGEPSAAIVTEALDLLTDASVRARLACSPGFELLSAGPASPLTDRWAAALTGADGQLTWRRATSRRRPSSRSRYGRGRTPRRSRQAQSAPASGSSSHPAEPSLTDRDPDRAEHPDRAEPHRVGSRRSRSAAGRPGRQPGLG